MCAAFDFAGGDCHAKCFHSDYGSGGGSDKFNVKGVMGERLGRRG